MLRFLTAGLLLAGATGTAFAATTTGASNVTFNKDVLPILQKNCQTCHRPGEIGPMAFLNYEGTRPWAKSIKQAVLTKQMPPWFADPRYGHFANERKLSDADIKTVVAWVDAGAPEGNAKDLPAPIVWTEGWNIKPDLTFQLPKPYTVPKDGTIQYTYFIVPSGLTKDTWVTDAEVRAGNRSVVHHASVYIRPPGSGWLKDAPIGVSYVPPARGPLGTHPPDEIAGRQAKMENEWFVGYVPGIQPQRYFAPETGAAKLIPAGSDIVFEMHYTANGKEAGVDQTKVGFVLAKEAPKYRLLTIGVANADFTIPPGDPNYEGHASATFNEPVTVIYLQPHMHTRGKDMEIRFQYPTGESQTMLNVPHYSYLWQTIYYEEQPLQVPKGTKVDVIAHWDNSANNPLNPDPTKTVRWGDQSWDEMLVPFVGVLVPPNVDPATVTSHPHPGPVAAP
jgi:mono/diheme cytochrome c family protein